MKKKKVINDDASNWTEQYYFPCDSGEPYRSVRMWTDAGYPEDPIWFSVITEVPPFLKRAWQALKLLIGRREVITGEVALDRDDIKELYDALGKLLKRRAVYFKDR